MTKQPQRYSADSSQATLWQFKRVIETGDVRYLLLLDSYDTFPEADIESLDSAWFKIYAEFSDALGNNRGNLWLMKEKHRIAAKFDLDLMSRAYRLLELFKLPETIDIANESGLVIDPDNLDQSMIKAKAKITRLKNKIKFDEKDSQREEATQDIDGLVVTLERFQGYQFDEHKLTVKQFANIYKQYKAKIEAQNKQNG